MAKTEDTLDLCFEVANSAFPPGGACAATDAAVYLAHAGRGESLRALAQATGTHPSTVLRRVRRIEARRDDPLFDRMVGLLERQILPGAVIPEGPAAGGAGDAASANDNAAPEGLVYPAPDAPDHGPAGLAGQGRAAPDHGDLDDTDPDDTDPGDTETGHTQFDRPELDHPELNHAKLDRAELDRAARRFLRRLSEPGSFLVISPEMTKGGIFCKANEYRRPIAMIPATVAVEFLRQGWIRIAARGANTVRYRLTDDGRSYLKRLLAEDALKRQPATGFAEATTPFAAQHQLPGERVFMDPDSGQAVPVKVNLGEDPLGWLARRKGPDGQPFLAPDEVEAGARLRQDFELAQLGPSVAQDWRKFLTPGGKSSGTPVGRAPAEGPMAARDRVAAALATLGPGLADSALRVCCFLEGLEACERRMGWSARSGKVVLKIALQRLSQHYGYAAGAA